MNGDLNYLVNVAVQAAAKLPLSDRIRVYRGAAIVLGDTEQAQALSRLAADLESVDQRCFEFTRQLPGGAR